MNVSTAVGDMDTNVRMYARYTTRQAACVLGLPFSSMDSLLRQSGFEPTVASRGSGRPRKCAKST